MSDKFIEIAGPCSAESREQVLSTAKELYELGHKDVIFRASAWKPRTNAGEFEGRGEKALMWLAEVNISYGYEVCTEVALPEHVELCQKYDIKLVWIGARTTCNPFAVQALAEALAKTSIKVLVKNPTNYDMKLWFGAIERLRALQVEVVGGILRGFSSFTQSENLSPYRNMPCWHAISTFCTNTALPIILDSSHIAGSTTLIHQVIARGLSFNVSGLMTEVHNNPNIALTDAEQQLTPKEYSNLMKVINEEYSEKLSCNDSKLYKLRSSIDELDSLLISTLKSRMLVVDEIIRYKSEMKLSAAQLDRYSSMIADRSRIGASHGLDSQYIIDIFERIHEESVKYQESKLSK